MLKILIFFLLLGELERVECRSSHEINKRLGAGDRMNPFKWTLFSKKDKRVHVSVESFKGRGIQGRNSVQMSEKLEELVRDKLIPPTEDVVLEVKASTGDSTEQSATPKVTDSSSLKKFIKSNNFVTILHLNAHGGGKTVDKMMMQSEDVTATQNTFQTDMATALDGKPKAYAHAKKTLAEAMKLSDAYGGWKFAIAPVKKEPNFNEIPDGVPEKFYFDNTIKSLKSKVAKIPATIGYSSVMSLKDLLDAMKESKSKRFFIIVDSCFSGNIMTSPLWVDFSIKNKDKSVVLITSSWIGVSSTGAGPPFGYTLSSMLGWNDSRFKGWHSDFDPFIFSGVDFSTPLSELRETIRKGIYLLIVSGADSIVEELPSATLTYSEETGFRMKYSEDARRYCQFTSSTEPTKSGVVYGKAKDVPIDGFSGTDLKMNMLKLVSQEEIEIEIVDRDVEEINALKRKGSISILYRCPFLVLQEKGKHRYMQWKAFEELSEEQRAGYFNPTYHRSKEFSTVSGTMVTNIHILDLPIKDKSVGPTLGDFFRRA